MVSFMSTFINLLIRLQDGLSLCTKLNPLGPSVVPAILLSLYVINIVPTLRTIRNLSTLINLASNMNQRKSAYYDYDYLVKLLIVGESGKVLVLVIESNFCKPSILEKKNFPHLLL